MDHDRKLNIKSGRTPEVRTPPLTPTLNWSYFCERDRHLFIFGKSSLPVVVLKVPLCRTVLQIIE